MVQVSATRCSCIAILCVSLVSFAVITLCVASQRVFIVVDVVGGGGECAFLCIKEEFYTKHTTEVIRTRCTNCITKLITVNIRVN
jgi:hypothetical protein